MGTVVEVGYIFLTLTSKRFERKCDTAFSLNEKTRFRSVGFLKQFRLDPRDVCVQMRELYLKSYCPYILHNISYGAYI
jgi:hypothetical protein